MKRNEKERIGGVVNTFSEWLETFEMCQGRVETNKDDEVVL